MQTDSTKRIQLLHEDLNDEPHPHMHRHHEHKYPYHLSILLLFRIMHQTF